jgi:hypothetical protein
MVVSAADHAPFGRVVVRLAAGAAQQVVPGEDYLVWPLLVAAAGTIG